MESARFNFDLTCIIQYVLPVAVFRVDASIIFFPVFTLLNVSHDLNNQTTALTAGLVQTTAFPQKLKVGGYILGKLYVDESSPWMTATLLSNPSMFDEGSIKLDENDFSSEIRTPVSFETKSVIPLLSKPSKGMHSAFQIHLEGNLHSLINDKEMLWCL